MRYMMMRIVDEDEDNKIITRWNKGRKMKSKNPNIQIFHRIENTNRSFYMTAKNVKIRSIVILDQLPSAWFNFSPLSRRPSEKSRSRSIKKITIDYYYHNIYYCHYLEHIIFLFLTFSPPLERPSKNLDRKNGKITIIAEHHRPSIIPFFVQFFFFFFLLFLSLLPLPPRLLLLFSPADIRPPSSPSPLSFPPPCIYVSIARPRTRAFASVLPITGSINIVTITNSASRCALTMTPLESQGYCYLHRSILSLPPAILIAYDRQRSPSRGSARLPPCTQRSLPFPSIAILSFFFFFFMIDATQF